MTYQNLWDASEAVLRGKFIAVKVYITKEERSQINSINKLEKEQTKPNLEERRR